MRPIHECENEVRLSREKRAFRSPDEGIRENAKQATQLPRGMAVSQCRRRRPSVGQENNEIWTAGDVTVSQARKEKNRLKGRGGESFFPAAQHGEGRLPLAVRRPAHSRLKRHCPKQEGIALESNICSFLPCFTWGGGGKKLNAPERKREKKRG